MIRRVAFVAVAVACAAAPNAAASDATSAQVAGLAARAQTDAQALAALRAIDRVDGRPVDLAAALDARGSELAARLRVLAAMTRTKTVASLPANPRASAHTILRERRFRGSGVPRPLHDPLRWLGRQLRRISHAVDGPLPGGSLVFWTIVAGGVAAAAALVAAQLGRRRAGRLVDARATATHRRGDDPRRLEREAEQAERRGDYERALRLRFRAGLIRLARVRALPEQPTLTNGEIARRLRSESFRELAGDFDEVVYGSRAAGVAEVARAQERWPRVVEEARRR